MSDATRVEVEGAEQLASTLRSAADDIREPERALDDSARLVQTRAQGYAPVDTGALRASIRAEHTGAEVTVGAGEPYGRFQEFGTVYVSANPFMRPALENSESTIVGYFERDIDDALGKVRGA